MKRNRKVKILVTLGPASSEESMICKLFQAGADVFRINMSHTEHHLLKTLVQRIRNVEKQMNHPIGILADLQGPKLRIGQFQAREHELVVGQSFTLDQNSSPGDATRVSFLHPEVYESVKIGERLLIDDGKLEIKVTAVNSQSITGKVISGKKISNHKGVSLPDTDLVIDSLTEKDKADLHAALEAKVDWIALSFIQRPENLQEIHKIVQGRAFLMSKIEKPQALEKLHEIIELSDALMVARGDLGVEMPLEHVPGIQKKIIHDSRKAGKPVIVATQMLESMIFAPTPTRAEVSDVSTAVIEGADAIMLSAETASGQYPFEAVCMMNKIAEQVEKDVHCQTIPYQPKPEPTQSDAIALAARQISDTLNPSAIFTYTKSGATALRISRERPKIPIVALSPAIQTARRLSLVWGTYCITTQNKIDLNDMVEEACKVAYTEKFAALGERIIIVAGTPLHTAGSTNIIRIAWLSEEAVNHS